MRKGRPLRFLSLFSGIEAASAAWVPLGWECVGVAEINPFACAFLAQRHPNVPNLGDITKITEEQIRALGTFDLVVFGSPCQDLSLAGRRKGFDGERSSLFFDAMRIVRWGRQHCGVRFTLWENVVGAFSSNEGRDFAAVVAEMAGLCDVAPPPQGWGTEGCALGDTALLEWCVLDAQWFGVAQRRRRCFALADFGDWANRPPVLLERDSLRGNSAPCRGSGQDVAGTLSARTQGGGGLGTDFECAGGLQPVVQPFDVANTLTARMAKGMNSDVNEGQTPVIAFDARQDPVSSPYVAGALGSTLPQAQSVAIRGREGGGTVELGGDVAGCLRASGGGGDKAHVLIGMQVRRLTPTECERLQGFPDGHTAVTYRGRAAPDSPRYTALGNSKAVPCVGWIGRQIEAALAYETKEGAGHEGSECSLGEVR